jgi:Flp pilus assembly protein TadG
MNKHMLEQMIVPIRNSRGAAAVMTALFLVVLLAMGAAAIDIGHALVARNELQNVSDAAALAGTRALGLIYEGMPTAAQQGYVLTGGDQSAIVAAVQATAVANNAAGVPITVNPADIAIGTWDMPSRTLTPTLTQPNAVRVFSRRDSSANGPISTFLANVVGMSSVNVAAIATAQLGPLASTSEGGLDLPLAISELFWTQYGCGDSIFLYPSNGTPQSCAGFTTFETSPSNDRAYRTLVNNLASGSYEVPATRAGETYINFTNGTLSTQSWDALINLFNIRSNGTNPPYWNAKVPVYEGYDCSPSGSLKIVGYANIKITAITGAPVHSITGNVECPAYEIGMGGGPPFGVYATLPGLVE